MNEIEKMYENANVEKSELHGFHCHRSCDICENEHKCKICKYSELIYSYPSFTAEKQLELIKWLSKYCMTIDCEDGEYEVYTGFDDNIIENFYDKLEDAIAYCVNKIWQNLAEEEKQQIKEILSK